MYDASVDFFSFLVNVDVPVLVRTTRQSRIYQVGDRRIQVNNVEQPTYAEWIVPPRIRLPRDPNAPPRRPPRSMNRPSNNRNRYRRNNQPATTAPEDYPSVDLTSRVPLVPLMTQEQIGVYNC